MDFTGALLNEFESLPKICWLWMLVAGIMTAIFTIWLDKRNKVTKKRVFLRSLLVVYIVFILCVTLMRTPGDEFRAEIMPFWSYVIPELRTEIIMNYILFIPFGFLLYMSRKISGRKVVIIGFLFSLSIETLQLIFRVGLFEFDDMFGNTIGCFAGFLIGKLVKMSGSRSYSNNCKQKKPTETEDDLLL